QRNRGERAAASLLTTLASGGRWCLGHSNFLRLLSQYVNDEEKAEPDHVDEVPVVGDDDCACRFLVAEVGDGVRASDNEEEGDETASDVQAVEAGREVERRAVRVGRQCDTFADESRVLPDLAGDEDRSKGIGEEEPLHH